MIKFSSIGKPQIILERPDGINLRLKLADCALFLQEAKNNGWKPECICKNSGDPIWFTNDERNYTYLFPNLGWVSDSDAKNIARALQKMVNQTEKFADKNVFDVEFHSFDELVTADFYEFWFSCTSAINIMKSMGGFIIIRPQDSSGYLLNKKKKVLRNFIKFCELGKFQILQVFNEQS